MVIDGIKTILKDLFYWKTMERDVEQLVKGCLHCIISRSGEINPRSLSHALHAERPNDILHLYYLYMGLSMNNLNYLLLIKDDLSSDAWFFPTDTATGEAAAESVLS